MPIVGKVIGRGVDPPVRWRQLTSADFGPLVVGTGGAFWDSLTWDPNTLRWTGTWAASHPGSGSGIRPAHRIFSPFSTCAPDFLQDGMQGVVLDVLIDSFSNGGTDARFCAGFCDEGGLAAGTEQGVAMLADDLNGTQTQLNGCTAVVKAGGSTNYTGVPDRARVIWVPGGDPSMSDAVGIVDYYLGATRLWRSVPQTANTTWNGTLGVWFGACGVLSSSGGGVVFGGQVGTFPVLPDLPA